MKRLLLFFYFIHIYSSGFVRAQQVYPYLNASTGNEGQYVIDADTNIYMYQGNQLEKLDKNFNPIWVKTYDGLEFYSLLLSKTGSLFFIAKDLVSYTGTNSNPNTKYVGKIDNNGNAVWTNTVDHPSFSDIYIRQLLLDRNNNLMLSGEAVDFNSPSALLIKLDTLGNMIFFKHFAKLFAFSHVTILNDSSGYYKCIYTDHGFEHDNVSLFTYSEPGDSVYSQSGIYEYPQHYYITTSNYYKSRNESDVYYSFTEHVYQITSPRYTTVRKYKNNSIVWNKKFPSFYGSDFLINSFDEDENKNVIFTISPKFGPGNNHTGFYNMCFKFDSTSVFSGQYKTLFSYNWWPPSSQPESAKLHFLNNNTYFYDVIAPNFPSNPLSVTFLDSSLSTNCTTSTVNPMMTSFNGPIGNTLRYLTTNNTPPYTLISNNPTVNTVTNFTINTNYCLALNIKESDKNSVLEIYPNPANNSLNINSNYGIIKSTVYDVTVRIVLSSDDQTSIDVSKLNSGLYFIKIKTEQGEFSRKFIKE